MVRKSLGTPDLAGKACLYLLNEVLKVYKDKVTQNRETNSSNVLKLPVQGHCSEGNNAVLRKSKIFSCQDIRITSFVDKAYFSRVKVPIKILRSKSTLERYRVL